MIWRLIYNDSSIIDLLETSDITVTPYKIYESLNIEDCFKVIDSNKLFFIYQISDEEFILFENGTRTIIKEL